MRLRLDIAYDGTGFAGWARQPDQRTVQATLEDALTTVLRLPWRASLTVAGRTDSGVHARGQVAHLDVPRAAWPGGGAAVRRLAGALPPDVRVRGATEAPPGFDARFSALWRRYAYRVGDAPGGVDPLRRHEVLRHDRPLDERRMDEASRALLGEHDFAAFCRAREGATTIRTLLELSWRREEGLVVGTVVADAFCHSMVRALVGALLPVGDGRRPGDWPARMLAGAGRSPHLDVVPARGLTLEEVRYPDDGGLAARVLVTRRPRAPRATPPPGRA